MSAPEIADCVVLAYDSTLPLQEKWRWMCSARRNSKVYDLPLAMLWTMSSHSSLLPESSPAMRPGFCCSSKISMRICISVCSGMAMILPSLCPPELHWAPKALAACSFLVSSSRAGLCVRSTHASAGKPATPSAASACTVWQVCA